VRAEQDAGGRRVAPPGGGWRVRTSSGTRRRLELAERLRLLQARRELRPAPPPPFAAPLTGTRPPSRPASSSRSVAGRGTRLCAAQAPHLLLGLPGAAFSRRGSGAPAVSSTLHRCPGRVPPLGGCRLPGRRSRQALDRPSRPSPRPRGRPPCTAASPARGSRRRSGRGKPTSSASSSSTPNGYSSGGRRQHRSEEPAMNGIFSSRAVSTIQARPPSSRCSGACR